MVKKAKKTLRVSYNADKINKRLDDALEQTVKAFGYKFRASGYALDEKERDLVFEKEEK